MAEAYSTFGSYILFKELGQDVLGHTYRAGELDRDSMVGPVLLRVLDAPQVPREEVVARFPRGRRVAASLTASSIARKGRFISHQGVPALACEYVSARPLSTILERARTEGFPVPVDNALLVLEKVAMALTAALATEVDGSPLAHGFVHPGLVLVSTDGEALVSGFGVADALLGMLDHADVAGDLQPYLAPEVLLTRTPTRSGDVYSLGALLAELLTGAPLPADPSARAGFLDGARLVYDEQPLPADIAGVLSRAVAPRPAERYSSAADFRQELERLLYGGAYSPTTFNLALFMDRLLRTEIEAEERERAAEAAIDVTPYLLAEPPLEPPGEAHLLEPAPSTPSRRRGLWMGLAIAAVAIVGAAVIGYSMFGDRLSAASAVPPTPTADEIAARRQAEDERLQQMVQSMVQEKMAEREKELRDELLGRQARIQELQRRLQNSERKSRARQLSANEQQKRNELKQQIAQAEAAQAEGRAALAAEQQRRLQQEPPPATAPPQLALAEEPTATPPAAPSPTVPAPTATAPPTVPPSPTTPPVTPGMFLPPSAVDTLPVLLRDARVTWPRPALRLRDEGVVIVQATVDGEGKVIEARVLRADHEGFGVPDAVVAAVLKYRFKPATKDGVPVTTYATVTKRYIFTGR
jgi:TonB family protein